MKRPWKFVRYFCLTIWTLFGIFLLAGVIHSHAPAWGVVLFLVAWSLPIFLARLLAGVFRWAWSWIRRAAGSVEAAAKVCVKVAARL